MRINSRAYHLKLLNLISNIKQSNIFRESILLLFFFKANLSLKKKVSTIVCSEISLNGNSCHVKTSKLIALQISI